jgi:hypothetical protein
MPARDVFHNRAVSTMTGDWPKNYITYQHLPLVFFFGEMIDPLKRHEQIVSPTTVENGQCVIAGIRRQNTVNARIVD